MTDRKERKKNIMEERRKREKIDKIREQKRR